MAIKREQIFNTAILEPKLMKAKRKWLILRKRKSKRS